MASVSVAPESGRAQSAQPQIAMLSSSLLIESFPRGDKVPMTNHGTIPPKVTLGTDEFIRVLDRT